MLYFVGIGIDGCNSISLNAIEIMKGCQIIYIERFTSYISKKEIEKLAQLIDPEKEKKINLVQRWFIEDGKEILSKSKNAIVAIVTYGDPFMATTMNELLIRAKRNLIETRIVHSSSGLFSFMGESGLHNYKFGRTTTIMSDPQSAISVYNIIYENLKVGNHTLILTEYNNEDDKDFFFLNPQLALEMLVEVEKDLKYGIISEETFIIVGSRIGTDSQKIQSGKIHSFENIDFGEGPHSIIIPGQLHFTEIDSITSLYQNFDNPSDNTKLFQHLAVSMVNRYLPKAKEALKKMKSFLDKENSISTNNNKPDNKGMYNVLENAEYYLLDSERFLNQNKYELAVLSIGYAEGLIDSLRFQKDINPWLP